MSWRVIVFSSVLNQMFYICSIRMRTKGQHSVNQQPVDIKVWGRARGASRVWGGWDRQRDGGCRWPQTVKTLFG
jgi:hypothetical protein